MTKLNHNLLLGMSQKILRHGLFEGKEPMPLRMKWWSLFSSLQPDDEAVIIG
jgi:hypothetical protein